MRRVVWALLVVVACGTANPDAGRIRIREGPPSLEAMLHALPANARSVVVVDMRRVRESAIGRQVWSRLAPLEVPAAGAICFQAYSTIDYAVLAGTLRPLDAVGFLRGFSRTDQRRCDDVNGQPRVEGDYTVDQVGPAAVAGLWLGPNFRVTASTQGTPRSEEQLRILGDRLLLRGAEGPFDRDPMAVTYRFIDRTAPIWGFLGPGELGKGAAIFWIQLTDIAEINLKTYAGSEADALVWADKFRKQGLYDEVRVENGFVINIVRADADRVWRWFSVVAAAKAQP